MANKSAVPVVYVRAKLVSATPDRTNFKPYGHTLEFENVYVDIAVPASHVIEKKGEKIVLDVDGMAIVLDGIATAIEEMNERWTKSKYNPNENRKLF